MNRLNCINLMISIIIKKFDHYQSTQSHHQLTSQRFYLSLNKIFYEHVYLSQNDEILISHKEIRKRDFVYKSRTFFVNKILSEINSINTSNLRFRKNVFFLFDCFRIIILIIMNSIASIFWNQFSLTIDSLKEIITSWQFRDFVLFSKI
jgi:ATP-dependent Zn protease